MSRIARVMRPHLAAVWAEKDPLVQRVAKAVTRQVPSYATTPSSEVWIGMTRILERAAHGNPFDTPTEEDRLAAFGTGVQGAGAGIPPEDLVAAILLGAREVEAEAMSRAAQAGVSAEDRLLASDRSRRWAEQVAVWAAQALVGAGHDQAAEQHLLGDRLLSALQDNSPADRVREQAARAGLDLAATWFAVILLGDPTASTTLRMASEGGVWSVRAEETCGLLPKPPRTLAGLVVGLAGPGTLDDLGAAIVEARRAAHVARRFGLAGVHRLEELGLLVPLHEDPTLAARLVARWLEPLATQPRHDLLRTVRTWAAHDGQVDRVGRELGVHANTVRNRLARVSALLGEDWLAPRAQAEIWAALQVAN